MKSNCVSEMYNILNTYRWYVYLFINSKDICYNFVKEGFYVEFIRFMN